MIAINLLRRRVPLTQGKVAFVDADDYGRVVAFGSWCVNIGKTKTYAVKGVKKNKKCRLILLHRFVLGLENVSARAVQVDHINHDGLDCRKINMRPCNKSQNGANTKGYKRLSRFKGVCKKKYGWVAQIKVKREYQYLGFFKAEEDAAKAYDAAARKHFGDFAYCNFLGETA